MTVTIEIKSSSFVQIDSGVTNALAINNPGFPIASAATCIACVRYI